MPLCPYSSFAAPEQKHEPVPDHRVLSGECVARDVVLHQCSH